MKKPVTTTRRRSNRKANLKRQLGHQGDPALIDTDRKVPKAKGGTYTKKNTRLMQPRAHMKRHGNLRVREKHLALLKASYDEHVQILKAFNKINNQLLAYERRVDDKHPGVVERLKSYLEPLEQDRKEIEKLISQQVHDLSDVDPLVRAALGVRRSGPLTVAGLTVYIDLEKAEYASSVWKYLGLDKASHERYTKGEASGGNKSLRTRLYITAEGMMKDKNSAYRVVYDQVKNRLSRSKHLVWSRTTQGKLVEIPWKDTKPNHRHGAALRAIMKHFVADYWFVGRELLGLPTAPLYVEEKLGHTGIIRPEERGWVW